MEDHLPDVQDSLPKGTRCVRVLSGTSDGAYIVACTTDCAKIAHVTWVLE